MTRIHNALNALVLAAIWLATLPAGAATLDPVTPEQLAREAELIFAGEVVDVQYRMSETGPGLASLPHTFVTFHIDRLFKGDSETGDFITLRFRGGPVPDSDVALIIPGVPLFDRGTRSILFVRGNGHSWVPLVGWEQGRFRLVDGSVYTDDGREVWLAQDDAFVFGPERPLPEVLTHRMGEVELGRGASEPSQHTPDFRPPAGAHHATAEEFSEAVERLVARTHTTAELERLSLQPSSDPEAPFRVTASRAVAPPREAQPSPPSLKGEPDPVEERMVADAIARTMPIDSRKDPSDN